MEILSELQQLEIKYHPIRTIGMGTWGIVTLCHCKSTNRLVALKAFEGADKSDLVCRVALREARMLKQVSHPNIIPLLEVFRTSTRLYLVLEYVELTLLDLIEKYPRGMSHHLLKPLAYQLASAIEYLHNLKIIHRDMKPENVLVSKDETTVQLCDFGFARHVPDLAHNSDEPLTDYVATRWYRSPELLLGEPYGAPADIWGFGCLLGEMVTGAPLFPGQNDLDQLHLVASAVGLSQAQRCLLQGHSTLGAVTGSANSNQQSMDLTIRLLKAGPLLASLIKACLRPDPCERPTALDILSHDYFERLLSDNGPGSGVESFPPLIMTKNTSSSSVKLQGKQRISEGGGGSAKAACFGRPSEARQRVDGHDLAGPAGSQRRQKLAQPLPTEQKQHNVSQGVTTVHRAGLASETVAPCNRRNVSPQQAHPLKSNQERRLVYLPCKPAVLRRVSDNGAKTTVSRAREEERSSLGSRAREEERSSLGSGTEPAAAAAAAAVGPSGGSKAFHISSNTQIEGPVDIVDPVHVEEKAPSDRQYLPPVCRRRPEVSGPADGLPAKPLIMVTESAVRADGCSKTSRKSSKNLQHLKQGSRFSYPGTLLQPSNEVENHYRMSSSSGVAFTDCTASASTLHNESKAMSLWGPLVPLSQDSTSSKLLHQNNGEGTTGGDSSPNAQRRLQRPLFSPHSSAASVRHVGSPLSAEPWDTGPYEASDCIQPADHDESVRPAVVSPLTAGGMVRLQHIMRPQRARFSTSDAISRLLDPRVIRNTSPTTTLNTSPTTTLNTSAAASSSPDDGNGNMVSAVGLDCMLPPVHVVLPSLSRSHVSAVRLPVPPSVFSQDQGST
ncbi:hypothetical protein CEUSTIGMA_g1763.t1 [Chlamydomonas eustigma]|uniref:cyclin-dependent kinase n=1 Tax=Chlamydomonas eustigma TaxID=1157962 RepID=A0A250WU19_9CHLO|nr:hypothetical protein CEUSTIGMA_g1763.t1 [Chlamydomonas eustigma]|eukprot:GAX74314.1 hypothetical protein CEUSTIGMA_g1763.t1 [Chlamydomonas eustigma]